MSEAFGLHRDAVEIHSWSCGVDDFAFLIVANRGLEIPAEDRKGNRHRFMASPPFSGLEAQIEQALLAARADEENVEMLKRVSASIRTAWPA